MALIIQNVKNDIDVVITEDGRSFMSVSPDVAWVGSIDHLIPSGILTGRDLVTGDDLAVVVHQGVASVYAWDPVKEIVLTSRRGYIDSPFHINMLADQSEEQNEG